LYSAKDARPRAFATRAFTTAGGGDGDGEGINTATLDFIRRCNHAALRSADKHELRFFPPLREEEHLRGGGAEALKDAEPDDRFHTLSSGSSGISGDASITSSDPPPFGVNPSEWQDASDYGEDLVVRPYEPEIDFINERHIGNGAFADVSHRTWSKRVRVLIPYTPGPPPGTSSCPLIEMNVGTTSYVFIGMSVAVMEVYDGSQRDLSRLRSLHIHSNGF
jgi:hypothetical protein